MANHASVIQLAPAARQELVRLRDTAAQAYLRERAAAILKVADGMPGTAVAQHGLLRARQKKTVYGWLRRYRAEGIGGLAIRPGRGRKPAFSPSVSDGRGRA